LDIKPETLLIRALDDALKNAPKNNKVKRDCWHFTDMFLKVLQTK
jgi:hypothetical protein